MNASQIKLLCICGAVFRIIAIIADNYQCFEPYLFVRIGLFLFILKIVCQNM